MKKKKEERKQLNDKTKITGVGVIGEVSIVELYQTVKRRILDSTDFVEVTTRSRKKILFNKNAIVRIEPIG